MAERFYPWLFEGVRRLEGWSYKADHISGDGVLYLGRLADGRWFVDDTREKPSWAYESEVEARAEFDRRLAVDPQRWTVRPM